MTRQVLNRGTVANDGTGDTLRTTALKIEQNFAEIYNKLGDGSSLMPLIEFDSSGMIFDGTIANSHKTTLRVTNPTGTRTVTIPDHTGIITMDTNTQTLTNKTLTSPVLTTPQINDTSANNQYVFAVSELTADRIVTLPLLTGNDEITFNGHTQTLSNKTLQSPQINSPKIGTGIFDSAQNELIHFRDSASAVNHVTIANASSNLPAIIQAEGQSNASLSLRSTGTGAVKLDGKVALKTHAITSTGGSTNSSYVVTKFTSGTNGTHTLTSGTNGLQGEIHYLVNTGTAQQTINESNSNLATYANIVMPSNTSCSLIWMGDKWVVVSNVGCTLNT
jgi:hypothetical protein